MRKLVMLASLATCSCTPTLPTIESPASQAVAQESVDGIEFTKLADNVWMHTSYKQFSFGPFPSNGLIVIASNQTILIDSAWNDEQTNVILDWAETELKRPITRAVFTHAHEDKMGGVGAIRARGIATFAHPISNRLAPERNMISAANDLSFDAAGNTLDLNPLVIFYPGSGHAEDNIVVRIPRTEILFGGCLIRPADTKSLGNTADGSVDHWDTAVESVRARFPESTMIIPSHGAPGDNSLLQHTIDLVRQSNQS